MNIVRNYLTSVVNPNLGLASFYEEMETAILSQNTDALKSVVSRWEKMSVMSTSVNFLYSQMRDGRKFEELSIKFTEKFLKVMRDRETDETKALYIQAVKVIFQGYHPKLTSKTLYDLDQMIEQLLLTEDGRGLGAVSCILKCLSQQQKKELMDLRREQGKSYLLLSLENYYQHRDSSGPPDKVLEIFSKNGIQLFPEMTDYQIDDFLYHIIRYDHFFQNGSRRTPFCKYVKFIQEMRPQARLSTLLMIVKEYENHTVNSFTVERFFSLIQYRYLICSNSAQTDHETKQLWETFVSLHRENSDLLKVIVEAIRKNEAITLNAENLEQAFRLYRKIEAVPHYHNEALNVLETCKDLDFFAYAIEGLSLSFNGKIEDYLSLSFEEQRMILSRLVILRHREGLYLVHALLQRYQEGDSISPELLQLSLQLIENTQFFFDSQEDEQALLYLICSLLPQLIEEKTIPEIQVLSQAILSLAEVDKIRLKKQYRSGIFTACQMACEKKEYTLMKSCIQALQRYEYSDQSEETQEIIKVLLGYSLIPNLPLDMQREIGKLLLIIPDERALRKAWAIVHSPAWEVYEPWSTSHDQIHVGGYDLFFSGHRVLHENRKIMEKKILDQLGQCRPDLKEQMEQEYREFRKAPEKYPSLCYLRVKLQTLSPMLRSYEDLLYLPPQMPIYRGVHERRTTDKVRACDPIVDFFERGVGRSELSGEIANAGVLGGEWAKLGQFYFTTNPHYARSYSGVILIVLKGETANQAMVRGRVRIENDNSSINYVIYDTISHELIDKVYVKPELLEQLMILKEADLDHLPTHLSQLAGLHPFELRRFAKALQEDPHHLFAKMETMNRFNDHVAPDFDVLFDALVEENIKRLMLRDLVKKHYFPTLGFTSHL